jgi:hypothetical protein
MPLLLRVALVAVGFPLACVGSGWCLLAPVPDLDREERFAAAGGLGAAFLAAAAFAAFLTGLPPVLIDGVALLLPATALTLARLRPSASIPGSCWPLAGLSALGYVHLLCIQALLPEYVGGLWMGDWHHHYVGARVFAGLEPVETQIGGAGTYTVASRTPLFNLAAANVLEISGPDFAVYQTACTFLNASFLPVIYLLLRDLFGPRAARLGVLLAPLNLWMMHLAWFTWPKMLAAAFLLLALHFYLRSLRARVPDPAQARRYFLYCWVSALLGYMTHQAALVYLLVLAAHAVIVAIWEPRFGRPRKWCAFPALSVPLLLAPWYSWLIFHFGFGATINSTPTTQMDPTFGEAAGWTKAVHVLASVGYNLTAAVVPFTLAMTVWNGPWTWQEFYGRATDFYFNQVTGALTLSLSLYLLARGARTLGHGGLRTAGIVLARPEWNAVWAFALIGGVGAALLHPLRSINGVAHSAIFATSVLLVVLAWGLLSRAGGRVRAVVCAGMVVEFLVMFWTYVPLSYADPLLLDPYGINADIKRREHLVFLSDCLGSAWTFAVVAAAAVQLALVILLAVWSLGPTNTKPQSAGPE